MPATPISPKTVERNLIIDRLEEARKAQREERAAISAAEDKIERAKRAKSESLEELDELENYSNVELLKNQIADRLEEALKAKKEGMAAMFAAEDKMEGAKRAESGCLEELTDL